MVPLGIPRAQWDELGKAIGKICQISELNLEDRFRQNKAKKGVV
jgi:hypothetical protein